MDEETRIAHLASFPELNPNPVLELDPAGKVLYANPAVGKILREQGMSENPRLFLPGDFSLILPEILDGGHEVEREVRTGDRTFLVSMSWTPRSGTIRIYTRDITDRKQVEIALRESERRFRSLFEHMLDGYAYCRMLFEDGRPEDFVYLDINPAFEKLTGLRDVIGKKVSEVIPGVQESNPELFEIYGRVADSGRPERFETFLPALGIWFSISVFSPERDHFVAVFDNITERKRAEEALRRAHTYLDQILQTTSDSFITLDRGWRFRYVNHVALHLTGRSTGELLDRTIWEVFPEILGTPLEEAYRTAMEKGVSVRLENLSRVARGRWFDVEAHPMEDGITIVAHEVTDRKAAEAERERLINELMQKNAELERFTYTVSHDLKSPLITIKGFLGFLEEDVRGGDAGRLIADLSRIRQAADKMQGLLEDLLQLSRVGRIVNPPTRVSLGEITKEATDLVAGEILKRGVKISIAPGLPDVYGDRARLVEVMQNLLENAVKFMGSQAEPRIEIGIGEKGGTSAFFIRDNGIGIDPRYHDRIFGLFEKLGRNSEGSGVGLALVKRIIEYHGGQIWVESEGEGKGSTFWFTLPPPPAEAKE